MILDYGIYLGKKVQSMDEVIKSYGNECFYKDIIQFEERRLEPQLTQLEMAEKVLHETLSKSTIDKEKIAIIVFASNMSTRCVPTTALTLVNRVGLRQRNLVALDVNSNCSGALTALNIVKNLLKDGELGIVLAVDKLTMMENEDTPITHTYGDAATCMIIDNQFEDYYFSQHNNVSFIDEMQLPLGELQKGNNNMVITVTASPSFDKVLDILQPQISEMYRETHTTKEDFKAFCFTQGSGKIISTLTEALELDKEKVPFTGKHTGYTGACCPLINLDFMMNQGKIKRGDLIMFWGLGAGVNSTICAFRY